MTPGHSGTPELVQLSNSLLNRSPAADRRELAAAFLALCAACRLGGEGWIDLVDSSRTVFRAVELEERVQQLAHQVEVDHAPVSGTLSRILSLNLRHLRPSLPLLILAVDGERSAIRSVNSAAFGDWVSATIGSSTPVSAGPGLTPPALAEFMAKVAGNTHPKTVFDPYCRSGELLEASLRTHQPLEERSRAIGFTQNRVEAALARLRLFFLGFEAEIVEADALLDPLLQAGASRLFDQVVCDLPFGRRISAHELGSSITRQWISGEGSSLAAEAAYLRLTQSLLNPNGRGILRTSLGVLFRGGADRRLRQMLLEEDLVSAIVGLPPGLVPGSAIESALIVLERTKSPEARDGILMVDLSSLLPAAQNWADKAFEDMREAANRGSGKGRWVTRQEVSNQSYNLLPRTYLRRQSALAGPLADTKQLDEARRLEAVAASLAGEFDKRLADWIQ